MSRFTFLVISVLILVSCKKETIIEVEREYNWKVDDAFSYDNQLQMNSRVSGDLMFFIGQTFFSCMSKDDAPHPEINSQNVVPYHLWLVPPANRKMPIGKDFFVSYNQNGQVCFVPNLSPVNQSSRFELRLNELDESFRFINGTFYSSGESIVINDQNQVLIPYQDGTPDVTMALVDISYDRDDIVVMHNLDTIRTQIMRIEEQLENSVIAMEAIGSNFFVTTDNRVYRIDGNSQMEQVLGERLYQIFEFDNELYGVGRNEVFVSSDDGLTWNASFQNPGNMEIIEYTQIGERTVAYRFAQLWEVVLTNNTLDFISLDNDGLDGRSITSVSQFGDEVIITTLSGVFRKSFSEFFIEKEVEE